MNIKEKEKILEASCKKLLARDIAELNKTINTDIEKQIKEELEQYQQKEEFAYHKKIEKLEKDYNKQIYSAEMESKKEVLDQKKVILKELKKEVVEILRRFTNEPEYEEFLNKRIMEVTEKVSNSENSFLSLVSKDNEKYGNKIREKYGVEIKIMEDKYIGGCILEDKIEGLYIDNTIENSINENLNY